MEFQPEILIFFFTDELVKMGQTTKKSEMTFYGLILHCSSNPRVGSYDH